MTVLKQIKRKIRSWPSKVVAWGLIGAVIFMLVLPTTGPVWGQSPEAAPTEESTEELVEPTDTEEATPAEGTPEPSFALPGFSNFFADDSAEIARGDIHLDGRRLFTVAERADESLNLIGGPTLIERRVATIEERLQDIVEAGPDALEVISPYDEESNQYVLYANYSVDGETTTDLIMTVTDLDVRIGGTNPAARALELREAIQDALITALRERQPTFLRRQGLLAGSILALIVAASLTLTYFQRRLLAERRILKEQVRADAQQVSTTTENNVENTGEVAAVLLQQQMANRQRMNVNDVERRLLQLAQIGFWGGGLFFILGLFPYTRWLQLVILAWIEIPVRILLVLLVTYVVIRLSAVLIDRLFWVLQSSYRLAPEASQRLTLRFSTFSGVAKSITAVVIGGAGIITALSIIGVDVGPLLAGAGIIGLGISFASQSLIKDIINGFLILFEDQYGIGDVIIVGEVSGFVENMNLRITQLRDPEGRLITIPNSSISIVQNLSKEWARVDLMVEVAHSADIDQALALVDAVAQEMSRDRNWRDLIIEKPLLLGVDKLDHVGSTIRLWMKTKPLKQWDVSREYRRRLKRAFDRSGIPIGMPQQAIWFRSALDMRDSRDGAKNGDGHRESSPVGYAPTTQPQDED